MVNRQDAKEETLRRTIENTFKVFDCPMGK